MKKNIDAFVNVDDISRIVYRRDDFGVTCFDIQMLNIRMENIQKCQKKMQIFNVYQTYLELQIWKKKR